jgi:hypothetical protein
VKLDPKFSIPTTVQAKASQAPLPNAAVLQLVPVDLPVIPATKSVQQL